MQSVAVIGLGNISHRHRKNLKALKPDARVIAMPASNRQLTTLPAHADACVTQLNELIELRPEYVIVASPANLHASHGKSLLEAGIPCLIEKPLGASLDQAQELFRCAQKPSAPACAVGYCLRFMPTARIMKDLVQQHAVGEIYNIHIEVGQYLPQWRSGLDYRDSVSARKELGGGALLELSHELDYARWIFGPLALSHAHLRSSSELGLEVEDLVDVSLRTEHDAHVQIHLDFLQRQPQRFCRVIGNKGRLDWNLVRNELVLTDSQGQSQRFGDSHWQANTMYLDMLDNFHNQIAQRSYQGASVAQALEVVNLIDVIKQSA
ncbi:Gfo/Idh/MocA family protein [Pseudoalteromonas ruthenica]|uniref:Gfo/Idh/MocA family protein n=1 Tax=Pseudoalteromonas ruthenica TaxID=151081 RepID=UPI00110A95FA|nr:Gfo/Idh/MocA family oxidoreductase [Pseudoalteromonas ruthenica]TMO43813.1 oxidoreductase [Pseudoalteromonas ruthenica]TMO51718.1 oxidoreductase [Pseudoalteromonas ruthenica]